jgi:archaellum component FlaC
MSEGNIIYALVARGVVPLSGYSNYTGTFDQMCINYLKNVGPDSSAAVKLDNGYIIFYINEKNITYLIMAESSYPKEAALGCLESIKKEFQSAYEGKNIDTVESFGLNSEFQTKLRMKFDYFNSNKDISNEALGRLKDEMNRMKDEVVQASGLLFERSDKVKVLDDKADVLSRDSNTFYKTSKKVRRAELMKKIKLYGAIACAILILIYIIICISCGSLTFNC